MLNTATNTQKLNYDYQGYAQNPVKVDAPVIEGYFYKESTVRDMAIRKVNKSLCSLLVLAIITTFVSYYFVMCSELTLNKLKDQIRVLNDENFELQNNIDKQKSFNNVDTKMVQHNLLQKAENVMEVPAIQVVETVKLNNISSAPFKWSIGY